MNTVIVFCDLLEIHNCEVLIREDVTVDEFIDVIVGNRKYLKCFYCYNKIDAITMEEVDWLARQPFSCVISCEMNLNIDFLIENIKNHLDLIRIYTKKRGEYPDLNGGVILKNGANIELVVQLYLICSVVLFISLL